LLENGFYAIKQILFRRNDSYESKDEYQHKIMQERLNQRNAKLCIPINQFEYGYAISCHKSQGSEWDTVVVIDESSSFKQDAAKWLYTAVTRAKKKLILIR
jgi:DNA helicase IV